MERLFFIFISILLVYSCDYNDVQQPSIAISGVIYDSGVEFIKPISKSGVSLFNIPTRGQHFKGQYLIAPGDGKLEFSVKIYGKGANVLIKHYKDDSSLKNSVPFKKTDNVDNFYKAELYAKKNDRFLFFSTDASDDLQINNLRIKFIK